MAAKKDRVLWADDEIDLLKPHILFLQDKGYEVIPVISGQDAIESVSYTHLTLPTNREV
mgnify:CR=1 FL=1